MKAIILQKIGMTTIFTNDSNAIPVTILRSRKNFVTQIKTIESDGYNSVQLSTNELKKNLYKKPIVNHFKKSNIKPQKIVKEIRDFELKDLKLGDVVDVDIFERGEIISAQGVSKGKGFQGSIKRHNYSRGPMAHGSKYHRGSGSMGDIRASVRKTKKLPGHMGNILRTQSNLEIINIYKDESVILVKGSVPGPNKSYLVIRSNNRNIKNSKPRDLFLYKLQKEINELILAASKVQLKLTSDIPIEEMKSKLEEAKLKYEAYNKEREALLIQAKELNIKKYLKLKNDELKSQIDSLNKLNKEREKKEISEKENKEKLDSK